MQWIMVEQFSEQHDSKKGLELKEWMSWSHKGEFSRSAPNFVSDESLRHQHMRVMYCNGGSFECKYKESYGWLGNMEVWLKLLEGGLL